MTTPPAPSRLLRASAELGEARHGFVGRGSRAAAKAAAGHVLGAAAVALLLPAAGAKSRKIRTSSAPIPGGTAELVRGDGDEIGVGSGDLADALCAQSASSSEPAERISPISSSGWMTPVSLLTCWIATSEGPRRAPRSRARFVDQAVRPDRKTVGCSPIVADDRMFGCRRFGPAPRPRETRRSPTASLAPEVKMTS
jgi:hypothetical protein